MASSTGFPGLPPHAQHEHRAIRVAPVAACDRAALLELSVHSTQRRYVGLINDLLADDLRRVDGESMAILHGDTPIGYYRIEPRVRVVTGHDMDTPALGLRAFFIDCRWQRRGFGALAMHALLADLAMRYPWAVQVVLMVNRNNHEALALYRRAGFASTETEELYHGGDAGRLWLLSRQLSDRTNLT